MTIHWQVTDPDPSSGAPTQPADTLVAADGSAIVIRSDPSCDPAGNCAVGTVTVSLDSHAPTGIETVAGGATFSSASLVTVDAPGSDATSGVAALRLSNDGTHWATLPYTASVQWSLVDPSYGGSTAYGPRQVSVQWVDGAGNTSATRVAAISYEAPHVTRLGGADRFATAAAISRATFTPGVPVAYVATAYDFPDALAGAAAAGVTKGPILLAATTGPLAGSTADELARLRPARIVVLGGTGVISDAVASALGAYATTGSVTRLGGADRFATAAAISRATFTPGVPVAYVATAYDFPDALAGAAAAGVTKGPILLAATTGPLAGSTADELARLRPARIVVLGGTGVISDVPEAELQPIVASGASLPTMAGFWQTSSTHYADYPHDADGVILVPYPNGPEYNALTIANTALGFYAEWLAGGSLEDRSLFLLHADWLVSHQTADGLWLYTFAFGPQPVPWWSAMAEGEAISALVRAYRMTGHTVYATAATKALATFTRLGSDRGVMSVDGGYRWYEEYLWPYAPHTLNGFMFALMGLRDYRDTFGDALSASLYADGLRTLTHELYRFDTGHWSCYSLRNLTGCDLATLGYHKVQTAELYEFYRLTGDPVLKTYADRWTAYLAHPPSGV